MKILSTALLLAALSPLAAAGQSVQTTGAKPAWVMVNDSLVGGLQLKDDQRLALRDVEAKYQRGFDAITTNYTLTEAETKSRLDALNVEREREIQGVMTPEQYASWQQITAASRKTTKQP